MKLTRFLAWLAVSLCLTLNHAIAGASDSQPLELKIRMVPGLWITGITGTTGRVSVEYTTNLDQTIGWSLLTTVKLTNSPYFFVDAAATNLAKRFYRVSPPYQTNIIAILGDSISAPYPPHHEWTEFMTNYSPVWSDSIVHNFAMVGQGIDLALSRYATTVHAVRPLHANERGWLFVWLGLNDVGGKTPATIYNDLQTLWQMARADGFNVAAFTITRGGAYTPENGLYQQWDALNSLILSDQTQYNALCRPDILFPAPVDPLYFIDGVNPTPLGAQKIAEWIAQTMDPIW